MTKNYHDFRQKIFELIKLNTVSLIHTQSYADFVVCCGDWQIGNTSDYLEISVKIDREDLQLKSVIFTADLTLIKSYLENATAKERKKTWGKIIEIIMLLRQETVDTLNIDFDNGKLTFQYMDNYKTEMAEEILLYAYDCLTRMARYLSYGETWLDERLKDVIDTFKSLQEKYDDDYLLQNVNYAFEWQHHRNYIDIKLFQENTVILSVSLCDNGFVCDFQIMPDCALLSGFTEVDLMLSQSIHIQKLLMKLLPHMNSNKSYKRNISGNYVMLENRHYSPFRKDLKRVIKFLLMTAHNRLIYR